MFGLILYSVLTFMAAVSVLVFLEECVYIYKKVPVNKKSVIIWVNGAAPVRMERRFTLKEDLHHLFPDYLSMILVCLHIFCTLTQSVFANILHFLLQVIATMSCLGMWIPRSTMFTDMTSAWWVPPSPSLTHLSSLAVQRVLISGSC